MQLLQKKKIEENSINLTISLSHKEVVKKRKSKCEVLWMVDLVPSNQELVKLNNRTHWGSGLFLPYKLINLQIQYHLNIQIFWH